MATVKVWNDNIYPFKQVMKGAPIEIPAGEFIEMDYEEAVDFRGMFSPLPPQDYSGDEREFYKMIRVEAPATPVFKDDGLTNHLTGQRAASHEDLAATLAAVRHLIVKDPEAERAAPSHDVIADLKKQVADLTALVLASTAEKRGPGRPRKEA